MSDVQNNVLMFLWTLRIMCPTFRIPSLISRMVSVDVKDHVSDVQNTVPMVSVDVKDHVSNVQNTVPNKPNDFCGR